MVLASAGRVFRSLSSALAMANGPESHGAESGSRGERERWRYDVMSLQYIDIAIYYTLTTC